MKIFSLLSNKITDFLYKKEVISQEQKEVYIYGFTVLFLNILDILIILALGILIERYLDTIVFLMVFGITRQYTGRNTLRELTIFQLKDADTPEKD